jgi:hypothetical protein
MARSHSHSHLAICTWLGSQQLKLAPMFVTLLGYLIRPMTWTRREIAVHRSQNDIQVFLRNSMGYKYNDCLEKR